MTPSELDEEKREALDAVFKRIGLEPGQTPNKKQRSKLKRESRRLNIELADVNRHIAGLEKDVLSKKTMVRMLEDLHAGSITLPNLRILAPHMEPWIEEEEKSGWRDLCVWGTKWSKLGCPTFRVSHSLFHLLMHTDTAKWADEVKYPYSTMAMAVPPELADGVRTICYEESEQRVVWLVGGLTTSIERRLMLGRLFTNVILYINSSKPDVHPEGKHSEGEYEPCGLPQSPILMWMVGRSIKVPNWAQRLGTSDRTGAKLKVRFIVRGHFRRQLCGVGRLNYKTIWIKPFWKGPKSMSEALTRTYDVVDRPEGRRTLFGITSRRGLV